MRGAHHRQMKQDGKYRRIRAQGHRSSHQFSGGKYTGNSIRAVLDFPPDTQVHRMDAKVIQYLKGKINGQESRTGSLTISEVEVSQTLLWR